ncbi:ras GTPase-activating-like protein IQGAP1 isoform X4 [Apostichopus japonicus]|uniref:ras GTPase-activating-like protein IQGAP1 isoform X4 n=1 Tax=Stichopus japonicus TaxID=307972 RepID=UPI003AB4F9A0
MMDINWNKAEEVVSVFSDFANGLISPRYQTDVRGGRDADEVPRRRAFSFAVSEGTRDRHPSLKDTCWISENEDLPHRTTADEMDAERMKNVAYQYLCHLEEAKKWIEACISEELPPTTELEEALRNGVYLAKLAHFFAPNKVPVKKIYDRDQTRYQSRGLVFRHTDNIMHWFNSMEFIGLPKIFYPETTDIYDKKNMPRMVYCVHALSLYLFKLGIAPQIQDLYGKVEFTEEEISAMQQELDKYGIQMPAFSKIGGILANELSVDDAAVHAAVIAINEAVDKQDVEGTFKALQNPNATLKNLKGDNREDYQNVLYAAKQSKEVTTLNKAKREKSTSVREGEEQDVYDTLLTHAEIQGNVTKVNLDAQLNEVNTLLDTQDATKLLAALQSPAIGLKDVQSENAEYYLTTLIQAREVKKENTESPNLEKEDLQAAVNAANILAKEDRDRTKAVGDINTAISEGSPEDLVNLLMRSEATLPEVFPYVADLYQSELRRLKESNGEDLNHEQLCDAVKVLSAVSRINSAVDAGEPSETVNQLLQVEACIGDVDQEESVAQRYQESLETAKRRKAREGQDFVSQEGIQQVVDEVNAKVKEEHDRILAVAQINESVDKESVSETLESLQMPQAQLKNVEDDNAVLYQLELKAAKTAKAESSDDEAAVLWLDEIQETVDQSNKKASDANKLAVAMASVNELVDGDDKDALVEALKSSDISLMSLSSECALEYQEELKLAKQEKAKEGQETEWTSHRLKGGDTYYYNYKTQDSAWIEPENFEASNNQLTKEDIQAVVSKTTASYNRALLFQANEPHIIQLQAQVRGMLVRKRFQERKNFLTEQLPAIIKIQSWYKGYKQRQAYKTRMEYLHNQLPLIIRLQAMSRMWQARSKYRARLKHFSDNANAVVKLQAFWRSQKARNDYFVLTHSENPPVNVVRKYVHLLEQNQTDLTAELELQELRGKVVKQIRSNQKLEQDLNLMDIKIGLLIKNRITLQDVVSHGRNLHTDDEGSYSGLKALSKDKREMLEGYQNLLYLLQTNPNYLAKLIFAMPQSKTTKFMESVILTLYNYAANQREEYLLLKLFKTALQEEIKQNLADFDGIPGFSKVDKMMEIVTGNPMVIRMVVTFNRGQKGQSSLRDILQPLVTMVMNDKTLIINTNPVDVYKAWVNQKESETGETSKLPYDVSTEQALKQEEVISKINESAKVLETVTEKFLNAIISSVDKIPFGIRYIAKVLRISLQERFPDEPEEDIIKIVGNLIYYRYMNPAIVAPDAFDIVDISVEKGMTIEQRRNLGSITKVLQTIASGKEFKGESSHLSALNEFVRKSFPKFKEFCIKVCEVDDPEDRFDIDEYSDFVNPTKPIVFMSVSEIIDTHALLVEHIDAVATDQSDPLHELLEDLGDVPGVEDMLGEVQGDPNSPETQQMISNLGKTEISFTLTNKFEIQEDDDQDKKRLFIKTKRLLVDIVRVQSDESVLAILDTKATPEQEALHDELLQVRLDLNTSQDTTLLARSQSSVEDTNLPIESKKEKVKKNLPVLEEAEMVSSKDGYQAIVNAIAQDIKNQRRYRQRRKQDIMKMKKTLNGLETKSKFYGEQTDYYSTYIKTCLENLAAKRHSKAKESKGKNGVKYNAAKLHEKGVILEIEGLKSPSDFKNVMFEINPSDKAGVFIVAAKFLGVRMDSVDLVFQDLLQLQYEGIAVTTMFGRAKINVNLLIYLLNKKFYGK